MSESRLTPEMVQRVIDLVETEIRDHFGPKYPGGQRAIAEQMHLAQPTLNRLMKKHEGVGLDLVLALRAYLAESGRPKTIDEILGLAAPPAAETTEAQRTMNELAERTAHLEEMVRMLFTKGDITAANKKRVQRELEIKRLAAIGNRDARNKKGTGT